MDSEDRAGDLEELQRLKTAEDPRTVTQMKEDDTEWREYRISEVTEYEDGSGWSVQTDDSIGLGFRRVEGKPEPQAGDTMRVYGVMGFPFYGIDLNGVEVFWRTPWERFAKRMEMLAGMDRDKREKFERQREGLDADYESLPPLLKARIDRFRAEDAGFRVDGESYELFCCTEAAKFAERAREAAAAEQNLAEVNAFYAMPVTPGQAEGEREQGTIFEEEPQDPAERWLLWVWALSTKALGYDTERQAALLDYDDGHTGNTFGGAISMALRVLRGEDV